MPVVTRGSSAQQSPRSRLAILAFLATAVLGVLLRLPAFVEPIGIDQGIFITAGWGLQRGLLIYRDLWDQKPPGVHLTYALGLQVFGGRASAIVWLDLLAAVGTAVFLAGTVRRAKGWAAGLATAGVFLLLALPAGIYGVGGFLERAVPETFVVLFVTAAVWVAYPGRRRAAPGIASLAAGVLIGMAACYKPVALVFAPVPLVADWLEGSPGRGRRIAWFGAGLAVAPAAIITWLAAHGLVGEAWTAVVEYNRAYLTSQTSVMALADRFAHELVRRAKTEPLWALAILASPVGVWHIVRTRALDLLFVTALAWWGLATLGAAASGIRLFNSYFIPSHPAMAVLAGGLLAGAWTRTVAGRRALLLTAIGIAVFVCWRGGVFGRTLAITRLDAQAWWSGQSASPTYLERFGGYATGRGYSARANAELADRIQTETGPGDRVYIFGMAPSVYFMAQRLPSNRFLWVYPPVSGLVSRQGFNRASFAADLSRSAPTLFIFERNNRDSRTGWRVETDFASGPVQAFLRPYSHLVDIEDFEVFRHR